MTVQNEKTQSDDPVWLAIREEVVHQVVHEPILASFLHATILNHDTLEDALSFHLASKLEGSNLPAMLIRETIDRALAADPSIGDAVRADVKAVRARDPASHGFSQPFLHFKGFHALQAYRITHWLWKQDRVPLALFLQNRISQVFGADIHPAAQIGRGILIDHGTSTVIGETSVVEDDVSMLHEVTLGGTGKQTGDRHPKVREGVLIGAGAKILGCVEVGRCAKVGAGSVVLEDVPAHCTVAGVPAKIVGRPQEQEPSLEMDHSLSEIHTEGSGI